MNNTANYSSTPTQEMTRGVVSFPGYSEMCDYNQSICPFGNSATRPSLSQLPSITQMFGMLFAATPVVPRQSITITCSYRDQNSLVYLLTIHWNFDPS